MKLGESLFDVVEEKIKTVSGKEVSGKKAIVRVDTGEVLGVVSDKYKLVRHQEVLSSMEQVFKELAMGEPSISLCKRGAVMFAKFLTPKTWEPKEGDIVRFGLQVFNSYNGSLPVGVILIALRLKCSNGMTVPETMTRFMIKHYDSLSLGDIRRKSEDVLGKIDVVVKRWGGWSQVKVDEQKVRDFLVSLFGRRSSEDLYRKYLELKEGDTVWDFYQFLSYWSSNLKKTRKGNEESLPLLRWGIENSVASRMSRFNW